MFRSSTLLFAVVLLLGACTDRRDPISPRSSQPLAAISDGAHNGNPDFFWLPPIGANPRRNPNFDPGHFNGKLRPVVKICRLDVATALVCDLDVKTFGPLEVRMGHDDDDDDDDDDDTRRTGGKYHVNWDTERSNLQVNRMYRIQVFVGSVRIGFVDVDPVNTKKELRNVNTNEYIGLVDGKTLPIKFRIEDGALCTNKKECGEQVVTNAGGKVVTNSGHAGATFPAGWLPINPATGQRYTEVTVKIERVAVGADNICHPDLNLLQFEGCGQFSTDPDIGRFALPVTGFVCPELPRSDPRYMLLSFWTSGVGEETKEAPEAATPGVDCTGFTGTPNVIGGLGRVGRELLAFADRVTNFLSPNSAYAIDLGVGGEMIEFSRGGWVLEAEMESLGGDEQTARAGTALPTPISVKVVGHRGRPVPNMAITFSPAAGSVAAEGPVMTNADGVASTTWTLGVAAGPQRVTVSGAHVTGSASFTANALTVVANVLLQPARIDFGLEQSTAQIAMVQRDAAGNVVFPPGPCTWAITSNRGSMEVTQAGVVSTRQADNGVVTATCSGVLGSALVESGDFQFIANGFAQDATGDALPGGAEGAPDLMQVGAVVAEQQVSFIVDFEGVSVRGVSIHSSIGIDADQSPATGHPGLSSGGTLDNTILGLEYLLRIDDGSATLLKYNGTPNSFSPVTTTTCEVRDIEGGAKRITCSVSLAQLGYDDGYFNFKATAGANFPSGGNNGIRDQVTDAGQPAASTGYVIP